MRIPLSVSPGGPRHHGRTEALGTDGLEARCGVHTGAVAGRRNGGWRDALRDGIVGEAPNIAARLHDLAPPGSLVMSEATQRLVEGFFEVEPLGRNAQGRRAHRLQSIGCCAPAPRPTVLRPDVGNLTPLIGRESELGFSPGGGRTHWKAKARPCCCREKPASANPPLQTLRMQLRETPHAEIVFYRSPQNQTSALWPVIQQLHRRWGCRRRG